MNGRAAIRETRRALITCDARHPVTALPCRYVTCHTGHHNDATGGTWKPCGCVANGKQRPRCDRHRVAS